MAVVVKRASPAKNAAYGIVIILLYSHACMFIQYTQHCIVRTDDPTTAATKTAHQPAYLRSFRLPTPKAVIAPKVTLALSELGISHSRLVMPTRENVAQFESLLDATAALMEIKRLADKADYDIKVSRNRLGVRAKSQSAGDGEPRIENDDGMDIDIAQANGDVNRDIEEGN
jgi:DNA methyltransferase 1-associated protein 1